MTTVVKMVGESVDQNNEIRAYIKARSKFGCSLKQLMMELSTSNSLACMSYDTIRRWKNKFESGLESIKMNKDQMGQNLHLVNKSFHIWKSEIFLQDGCHICWLMRKTENGLKWPKSCFKCFQLMTKSSLPMSSQMVKLESTNLSPSGRLAIKSEPLYTANAQ